MRWAVEKPAVLKNRIAICYLAEHSTKSLCGSRIPEIQPEQLGSRILVGQVYSRDFSCPKGRPEKPQTFK